MTFSVNHLDLDILPLGTVSAFCALDGGDGAETDIPLPPQLIRAVPKRQGSYRGGRACAGFALDRLAVARPPGIWPVMASDRAPIWPPGVTGSISHTDVLACCLVGAAGAYAGLGIDIEAPVSAEDSRLLSPQVLAPEELDILADTPWHNTAFTMIFSAKEALYKAVYPTVGRFVGFDEARLVAMTKGQAAFDLAPSLATALGRTQLQVVVARWRGHILAICAMES